MSSPCFHWISFSENVSDLMSSPCSHWISFLQGNRSTKRLAKLIVCVPVGIISLKLPVQILDIPSSFTRCSPFGPKCRRSSECVISSLSLLLSLRIVCRDSSDERSVGRSSSFLRSLAESRGTFADKKKNQLLHDSHQQLLGKKINVIRDWKGDFFVSDPHPILNINRLRDLGLGLDFSWFENKLCQFDKLTMTFVWLKDQSKSINNSYKANDWFHTTRLQD